MPQGTEAVSVFASYRERGLLRDDWTDRPTLPQVVVVNELFARGDYPNQSAVGKRFRLNPRRGPSVEIVGVAKQSKYLFVVDPPLDYIYLPLWQNPLTGMTLLLRTAGPPGALAAPMRAIVGSLDPGQTVFGVPTM